MTEKIYLTAKEYYISTHRVMHRGVKIDSITIERHADGITYYLHYQHENKVKRLSIRENQLHGYLLTVEPR